jgi:excisionase family DNA binding protein
VKGNETIYGVQPGEISWQDVCKQLRIARPTLFEAVKLKQIPVVRRGRAVRFRQDLIDGLLSGVVQVRALAAATRGTSPAPAPSPSLGESTPGTHRFTVTGHPGRHRRLLERLNGLKSRRGNGTKTPR